MNEHLLSNLRDYCEGWFVRGGVKINFVKLHTEYILYDIKHLF